MLAFFGYFVANLRTFWCPCRCKWCGGAQKLTTTSWGQADEGPRPIPSSLMPVKVQQASEAPPLQPHASPHSEDITTTYSRYIQDLTKPKKKSARLLKVPESASFSFPETQELVGLFFRFNHELAYTNKFEMTF